MLNTIIMSLLALLPTAERLICEPEPEPEIERFEAAMLECNEPLCTRMIGNVPSTGPCRPLCGPWVPGVVNVCGGWECTPQGPDSACHWLCE